MAKKAPSAAQQAHYDRMRAYAQAEREEQRAAAQQPAPSPPPLLAPPPEQSAEPVSERMSFLARNGRRRLETFETADDLVEASIQGGRGVRSPGARNHPAAGVVTVEHKTDARVKMWKRGPYGWVPKLVPGNLAAIQNNIINGMMEYCPDCGGATCEPDPNTCPAKRGRKSIVCPVPNCNHDSLSGRPKIIYATGVPQDRSRTPAEFEVTGLYDAVNTEMELKAKMDNHIRTWHRDEAVIYGLFATAPSGLPARLGIEFAAEEPDS